MSDNQSNNKRIAKNTMFLYFRMLLSMIVGLYTSRIVLNSLGAEDFGVYGVVGGIVSMFAFINGSMSGATSRFLTFEMGRSNKERLLNTFSSAFIVHLIIALVIATLVATIGLWFLWHKLIIPDGRMAAATVVLVTSVIGMFITVTQVPYNATIIAHEKMNIYAYIELLNVFLKLLVVYLLVIGNSDKLILYAFLQLSVSFAIALVYRLYCIKHFEECHLRWIWDKAYIKPMLSFSGWDLFGNMSVTLQIEGTHFLINMFFGVIYNAAASVAATVQVSISNFGHNILQAFRPQIIKQYSLGNYLESANLIYQATKFSALLLVILAIPFILEMDYLLKIWLVNPPEMASTFSRIMLIAACVSICEFSVNIGIHASGDMKKASFLTGTCYLALLPILWFCYTLKLPIETAYYLLILVYSCSLTIKACILKNILPTFSILNLTKRSIIPTLIIGTITLFAVYPLNKLLNCGIFRLFCVFFANMFVGGIATLMIALNRSQRKLIFSYLKNKLLRFK